MKKVAIVFIHLMIWLIVIVAPVFIILASEDVPPDFMTYYILESLFHPIIFYTFFIYIIPATIYRKGKVFSTIFVYLISILALIAIKTAVLFSIINLAQLDFGDHNVFDVRSFAGTAVNMVFMVALALLVRIALYWAKDQRKNTELQLEEHKMEVELLKAQINPHFFFNTLNNIYSLVYKKSDDAPDAVMKLSEIMRYIIYDSKSQMVQMEKEVEQLNNYIELERLRSRDPGFIEIETHGNMSTYVVPPMLFLSFAENAFKHGKRKVKKPGIKFIINVEDGKVKFNVINHILTEPHNNHKGEGIGMQNTRRRLELLYPKCHKLNIKKDNEKYEVKLELSCKN
jgi:two-component system LytT family sensor kinase